MFGSLSALFGKNFLVGYLLPGLLIVTAFTATSDFCGFSSVLKPIVSYIVNVPAGAPNEIDRQSRTGGKFDSDGSDGAPIPVGRIALVVVAASLVSVLLLATNYTITRFLEGYGAVNPFRILRYRQVQLFRRAAGIVQEDKRDIEWTRASQLLAAYFPEREDLVLATRFGNIMRAFERYPQIVYAIEPIQTWARMEPCLPGEHRTLLEDAKGQLDFWLNTWFGLLLLVAFMLIALTFSPWKVLSASLPPFREGLIYSLPAIILLAFGCARGAAAAAIQYGMLIKSAFDLYRGDLAVRLGLSLPRTLKQERELWKVLAWTMLNRDSEIAERISMYRVKR